MDTIFTKLAVVVKAYEIEPSKLDEQRALSANEVAAVQAILGEAGRGGLFLDPEGFSSRIEPLVSKMGTPLAAIMFSMMLADFLRKKHEGGDIELYRSLTYIQGTAEVSVWIPQTANIEGILEEIATLNE